MKTFRISLLPARHGDSIWVEWGEREAPHQLLIDGGPVGAYDVLKAHFAALSPARRRLELFVITHIDADHIDGAVKLLKDPELTLHFRDIWFNGWPQLDAELSGEAPGSTEATSPTRGPLAGEYIHVLLARRGETWNHCFGGAAIHVRDHGPLPRIVLEGGLVLTLLSPTAAKLTRLRKAWFKAITAMDEEPGDVTAFGTRLDEVERRLRAARLSSKVSEDIADAAALAPRLDAAAANGSSIAFLAEYEGRRCAFLADAHAPTIEAAFARLSNERGERPLRLDALKVPHHGSASNVTRELLRRIACGTYLVSTDGSVFGHPDEAAIELIVRNARPARLLFNYRSDRNRQWEEPERQSALGYTAEYPPGDSEGISVDLLAPTAAP